MLNQTAELLAQEADGHTLIMLDEIPICCTFCDENYNILDCNQEALILFEIPDKQEYFKNFYHLSPKHQPDGELSRKKAVRKIKEAFDTGRTSFEWMHQKLNGEPIPTEVTLVRTKRKDNYKDNYIVVSYICDLRRVKESLAKVREANERAQIMLNATPLCCTFWDENCNHIDCNEEALKLFDLPDKQTYLDKYCLLSPKYQPDGELSAKKAVKKVREAFMTGYARFEWMHQKLNGEHLPTEKILVRAKQGNGHIVLGYTNDLRELKKTVKLLHQFEKLAIIDSLTGAYTRYYFMENAQKELETSKRFQLPFSIIMLDLDKFKNVNDTYGHKTGDEVLKFVVDRVKSVLRADNLFARYGGEEFILFNFLDLKTTEKIAVRMKNAVAESYFEYDGNKIKVTVSLGVAEKNNEETTLDEIIQRADEALYKAKANGRNRVECLP